MPEQFLQCPHVIEYISVWKWCSLGALLCDNIVTIWHNQMQLETKACSDSIMRACKIYINIYIHKVDLENQVLVRMLPCKTHTCFIIGWLWLAFAFLGPISLTVFFHRNSNPMEISFYSHLDSNTVIATIFLHGTTAVLSWLVQKFVVI